MLAKSHLFSDVKLRCFDRIEVEHSTSSHNIASIVREGKLTIVTLATAPADYAVGMRVLVASATAGDNNGTFYIHKVIQATKKLYIKNPSGVAQAGVAGTVTLKGVVTPSVSEAGTPVLNNEGTKIGTYFATSGSFILYVQDVFSKNTLLQVINKDAADALANSGGNTVEVTWSLDRVNWLAFPDALEEVTIAAGASYGFIVNHPSSAIYIRVQIVNDNSADFCVLTT